MTARRIIGRHLLVDGPGAAIDVPAEALPAVLSRVERGLAALGWPGPPVTRPHKRGVTIAVRAEPDVLRAATELLDWAAEPAADPEADAEVLDDVVRLAARRDDPALRALFAAFPGRVFVDEDQVVVGLGCHARRFPIDELPTPASLGEVRGIPRVCITGTNGKTTTTRLIAHLAETAGHTAGRTSSDGVVIGEVTVERGDWTGPAATRRVLGDRRVTFAALETARGGLLRRGLALDGADVAIVTNVASEHLGEWGVDDLETMARAKLVIALGLRPGGTLIVPAVSAPIHAVLPEIRARRPDLQIRTFSAKPIEPRPDAWADDDWLHFGETLVPVGELPITFRGTARHNVENALCATLAAMALQLPGDAISRGLRSFRPTVGDNPGRMNTWRLPSGALAVLDFAHNAHGLNVIVETVRRWNKPRRVLLLGQAGDRPDRDLRSLAAAAVPLQAERIVVKDVTGRLYARAPGEVPAILRRTLLAEGYPAAGLVDAPDEVTGVRLALHGATRDHVVVLLLHETLAAALAVLEEYGATPYDG